MPHFLEEDVLHDIFSSSLTPPNSAIQHLRNGLKCLGIHQVGVDILFLMFPSEKLSPISQKQKAGNKLNNYTGHYKRWSIPRLAAILSCL